MPNIFSEEGRGFETKRVTDTRATTDKNDPFLNVGFKHGKKWTKMGQNAIRGSGVEHKIPKKFFTSELFKVIQDAIPLILHFQTRCQFRTISSSTFVILDVQSVYTRQQIQD